MDENAFPQLSATKRRKESRKLPLSTDQWRQIRTSRELKAALPLTNTFDSEQRHRGLNSLESGLAKRPHLEGTPQTGPDRTCDQDLARSCLALDPSRYVGGPTHHVEGVAPSFTDLANDHLSAVDSDPGTKRVTFRVWQFLHGRDGFQSCRHRLPGVAFTRLGVPEPDEESVPKVFRDDSSVRLH